uniref:Transglutaminase-like domain-containing protein n=1 Tax=Leptobrachium leishanense TaxID=445787 RepID=A0A8C5R492_9ANUR
MSLGMLQAEDLLLLHWDLYRRMNSQDHRTSDFLTPHLVVRRGQPFYISCTFNRNFSPPSDSLALEHYIATFPAHVSPPVTVMPLAMPEEDDWHATCVSQLGPTVIIKIRAPLRAVIGRYRLKLRINTLTSCKQLVLGEFYMLFNPWHKEDMVYMPDEADRREYVLCETGIVYSGTAERRSYRPWDYGQFEEDILDISMSLLDKVLEGSKGQDEDICLRAEVISISKLLNTLMVNKESGVILGNWSGKYSDGFNPTTWNGSASILRRWKQNGTVRYGQCWVIAGLLCTVFRCLGIPSRVVTCFEVARRFDRQFVADCTFQLDGKSMDDHSNLWNFRSWTDIWIAHTPIEDEIPLQKGWHTVTSSLSSVLKEKVYTKHQTVGQFIGTKAPGAFIDIDVKEEYKYPEGSVKRSEVMARAMALSERRTTLMNIAGKPLDDNAEPSMPDFEGSIEQLGETCVGETLTATLTLKNNASVKQVIEVCVRFASIMYTKEMVKEILCQKYTVHLEALEEKEMHLYLTYDQYKNAITVENLIQMVAVLQNANGIYLLSRAVAVLKSPPLVISTRGNPVFNQTLGVEVQFYNPLTEYITNCRLMVEGSGLLRTPLLIILPPLQPMHTSTTKLDVLPYRPGARYLMHWNSKFNSFKEMSQGKIKSSTQKNNIVRRPRLFMFSKFYTKVSKVLFSHKLLCSF